MAYRRFLVAEPLVFPFVVTGDLFHHVRDVCRFDVGERFELLTGDGRARLVEITRVGRKDLEVNFISERELPALPKPRIVLCLSIPKLPKVDWIIEKSVELGVHAVRPFVSEFSFLRKTGEISPNRLARWDKLADAAVRQSGRGQRMTIHSAVTLPDLLADFNRTPDVGGLFPYEGDAQIQLRGALSELKQKALEEIWIFVGSEGGFSRAEVDLFARNGLPPVSLGAQILRVETACLALVSVIKYEYEQFEYGSIR